ncbi:phage holin family protein [Candidatus Methylacidithermus pantelleriae]|uniref:Uncharacterized protein n=1 Tax=Candidatus Methylacidithermus pantelleriae TaxID=2744239 RepID=A0A8J2BQH3_9BACT|nr:phage holin family protein [Candidatus Methylacidithermus pantelleriae]CAF0689767.1 conserved hypothetical protein [Candidatus Methylacidithermus pantelleriae]
MGQAASGPREPTGTGRSVCSLLFELLRCRLELWSLELHEHLLEFFLLVLLGFACVFVLLLGLMILTVAFVFLVWRDPGTRLLGLFSIGLVYCLLGVAIGVSARSVWRRIRFRLPFSEVLGELEKDRQWLETLFKK